MSIGKTAVALIIGVMIGLAYHYVARHEPAPAVQEVESATRPPDVPTSAVQAAPQAAAAARPVQAAPAQGAAGSAARAISSAKPGQGPLKLGPEFDGLFNEDSTFSLVHIALENEVRDEKWAPIMEGRWTTAFAENTELLKYGTPTVHCRATRCEIHLLANDAGSLDRQDWLQLINRGAVGLVEAELGASVVKAVRDSGLVSVDSNGGTALVYFVQYER
jgi:hypothetical protein